MKTSYVILLFVIVAGIQLFVPAKMILDQEHILAEGKAFKFRTQPIDPNDPFRGKYIVLNYKLDDFKTLDSTWSRNDDIFVIIEEDSLGYAKVNAVSKGKPSLDKDFVEAKVTWYNNNARKVNFDLAFDRFYMEETKALEAEKTYNRASRDSKRDAYALVYILNGKAVLKDVIIDGKPIASFSK